MRSRFISQLKSSFSVLSLTAALLGWASTAVAAPTLTESEILASRQWASHLLHAIDTNGGTNLAESFVYPTASTQSPLFNPVRGAISTLQLVHTGDRGPADGIRSGGIPWVAIREYMTTGIIRTDLLGPDASAHANLIVGSGSPATIVGTGFISIGAIGEEGEGGDSCAATFATGLSADATATLTMLNSTAATVALAVNAGDPDYRNMPRRQATRLQRFTERLMQSLIVNQGPPV